MNRLQKEVLTIPHATIKAIAKGFVKLAKKEFKEVKEVLIEEGKSAAIAIACDAIEARTGLPSDVCERAGEEVVKFASKEIRERLSK